MKIELKDDEYTNTIYGDYSRQPCYSWQLRIKFLS